MTTTAAGLEVPTGTLMQGKRGLVMGVANNRSLAWGIAKATAAQGATLAFTYQGDALKKRVEPLAQELGSSVVLPCDVTDAASIDAVFAELQRQWGKLDFLVHAIAFSDKAELDGRYLDTTREELHPDDVDLLLFVHGAGQARREADGPRGRAAHPHLLRRGESHAPLQRDGRGQGGAGSKRALSCGRSRQGRHSRQRHLGRPDQDAGRFRHLRLPLHPHWNEYNSALRRTVTIEEVGAAGFYLLSDLSRGVTGEVHHVDAGYHVQGMKNEDAPDISVIKDSA